MMCGGEVIITERREMGSSWIFVIDINLIVVYLKKKRHGVLPSPARPSVVLAEPHDKSQPGATGIRRLSIRVLADDPKSMNDTREPARESKNVSHKTLPLA